MNCVINSPGKGIFSCSLSVINLLGARMNEQKMVLGMSGSSKAIEKCQVELLKGFLSCNLDLIKSPFHLRELGI